MAEFVHTRYHRSPAKLVHHQKGPSASSEHRSMELDLAAARLQAVARGRLTRWRLRSPLVRAAARAGLWPPSHHMSPIRKGQLARSASVCRQKQYHDHEVNVASSCSKNM